MNYIMLLVILLFTSLSLEAHDLPKVDKDGRISTMNQTGWVVTNPKEEVTDRFIKECSSSDHPSLELGAGYGHTTMRFLKSGNAPIVINDLDSKHIDIFKANLNPKFKNRVELNPGDVRKSDLFIAENKYQCIYSSRMVHFLNGEELDKLFSNMFHSLKKGGKIYIVADTPFLKPWSKFLPVYEQNKKEGKEFPGIMENPMLYNSERGKNVPNMIHFLDVDTLTNLATKNGFKVEFAQFLQRKDYPDYLQLDGRESVGLIATK